MRIKYPGVVLMSVAMALHAAIAGRYLESVFFLVAFCWAWVAVTAMRDRLQSARSMVLTMLGLLVLIVLPVTALRLQGHNLVAHMSLAVMPSIISWACMLLYLRHMTAQAETADLTQSIPEPDWMAAIPTIAKADTVEELPSFAELVAVPAMLAPAPVIALAVPAAEEPAFDMGAPDPADLTIERVTEIIASLRGIQPAQEAA